MATYMDAVEGKHTDGLEQEVSHVNEIKVERLEWLPVKVHYSVKANTLEDALNEMNIFDNGGGDDFVARLHVGEVNSDAEPDVIDEEQYWKIDGKMVCELTTTDEVR